MRTKRSRLDPLLEDVSDAVILTDRDGTILDASPGVQRILGYNVLELTGRAVSTLCRRSDVRRLHKAYATLTAIPGHAIALELSARRRDGSWWPFEFALRNGLGDRRVRAVIVTCRDIGARRDIEHQRERQERHAQLLADAALEFSRYQEPTSLFPVLARRCTELFGDWCLVFSVGTGNPPLRLEALHHADPRSAHRLREIIGASPLRADEGIVEHVLRDSRPFVVTRDDPGIGPERARRTAPFWTMEVSSLLSSPIYVAGQPLGVFCVASEADRPWDEGDLRLASLIADRAGSALHNAQLIVSERIARQAAERTAERTNRLQRATADLSEAVTIAQVSKVILHHAVAALGAHAGSISVLNRGDDTLQLVNSIGYPEAFERAWRRLPVGARPVAAEAVRMRQPLFFDSRAAIEARYDVTAPHAILPFDGARAIVPLTSRRDVLGILSLAFPTADSIVEEERALIVTLTRQCALALERAQLYEREHRVAETLQRTLLPTQLPIVPGVEIAARYIPAAPDAKVGGDWYDALALSDGRLGLAIGDVAGRGLHAASVMGRLRNAVRAYAIESGSPLELVRRVGRFLDPDEMVTLVYLMLDPIARTATYANAGHVPPLLVTPDGHSEFLAGVSLPLCRLRAPHHQRTVPVPDGSKLILYTDGLVEDRRRHDIDEGFQQLRDIATTHRHASAEDLAETIVSTLSQGSEQLDDVAVLVVSMREVDALRLQLHLPAVPESARVMRRSLARWLMAADIDDERLHEIVTAVGEACNNAIEHAYGGPDAQFSVEAGWDADTVEIVVRDHGHWRPPRPGRRGHGLTLMNALMDLVEIERRPDGTTVRLRRQCPGTHP